MLTRLLPLAVLFVAPAFSAELHGTVTSGENQAPITGVSVLVRGPAGVRLTSLTDDQGVYRLTGLDKSLRYSIEVNAEGFKPFRQDVQISSESQQIDIHLDLSSVLESVVVKGSGEVISTVSNAPSVSETIPLAEIAELPTSNRNVTKYALLNPHVRQTQGLNSDGNNGNRLSINAQSSRHTAYVTDGVINYDWVYANGPFQLVSASAVEDVSVLTNQYAAEYGTTTAGIVKIDTQSGTNQLGGEAFAFVIPSGIQANPPVSTFHTPNEREQWGGLLGGTLVKDKAFFFGSYEGIRQVRGSFIQSPTPGFFVGQGDEIYGLTRVDQNFTDNHAISIRLNGYHYRNTNANDRVGGFNQISFGRIERSQSWGGQVTDRLIIGHLLNYLRFNFSVFSPDNNTPTGPFSPSVGINRPSYSVSGFSQFNWDRAKLVDLSDTVAFNGGRNNFKFGVEAVRVKVQDFLTSLYGTYNFPAGPPTPGKNPLNYTQTFGAAFLRFGETSVQTFAQDDFKISSRVSGNLGLRYEHQSFMDSPHNFAPRVGLAWDVMGDGKTRVTAGAGLFFDMIPLIQLRDALRNGVNAPLRTYTIPFGVPGFPTFPNSLTAPPTGIQAARLDLTIRPAKYLNPYSVQTSVGVERDLGRKFVVMANGIYAHTVHQLRNFDINHPAPFIRTAPEGMPTPRARSPPSWASRYAVSSSFRTLTRVLTRHSTSEYGDCLPVVCRPKHIMSWQTRSRTEFSITMHPTTGITWGRLNADQAISTSAIVLLETQSWTCRMDSALHR
jgi:hypothetical protein